MSDSKQAGGSCLCGKVQITAATCHQHVHACHCSMCRKWGGGPALSVDCGTDVAFQGEEHIRVFSSSVWAERGFCTHCGSHLFYRLKETQQYIMPVGLFDDGSTFTLDQQIFIDEKPEWYTFANRTEDMTGAEVFAKYAPPTD